MGPEQETPVKALKDIKFSSSEQKIRAQMENIFDFIPV